MEKFKASNGVEITVSNNGLIGWSARLGHHAAALALFEFFENATHRSLEGMGVRGFRRDRKEPWHSAEPGEVWALTGAGGLEQPWRRMDKGRWFSCTTGTVEYNDEHAIAGRRIWPEVVSDV